MSLPYHLQHLGIPRKREVSCTEIPKAWGVMQFGIPNTSWGRGLGLNFQLKIRHELTGSWIKVDDSGVSDHGDE